MVGSLARRFGFWPVLTLSVLGCHQAERDTAIREPEPKTLLDYERPSVSMADNALLHNLSLTDLHFVPHTTELNGLGAERLDRLARLLSIYGGTLRYQTDLSDRAIVDARMSHIREYLNTTGLDVTRVAVAEGVSGGRGMSSEDALAAMEATRTKPDGSSSSSSAAMSVSGQSSSGSSSGQ